MDFQKKNANYKYIVQFVQASTQKLPVLINNIVVLNNSITLEIILLMQLLLNNVVNLIIGMKITNMSMGIIEIHMIIIKAIRRIVKEVVVETTEIINTNQSIKAIMIKSRLRHIITGVKNVKNKAI